MRKICSLFFVLMLIFQTLSMPVYASFDTDEIKYRKGIITVDNQDNIDVPLYKDHSDPSSLLTMLHNGDEVNILEVFESFSYVAFNEDESTEMIEGFIENQYLSISEDENNEKNVEINNNLSKVGEDEDSIDIDESVKDDENYEPNEEIDDDKNPNIVDDEDSIDTNESVENNEKGVENDNHSDLESATEESEKTNENSPVDEPEEKMSILQVQPFSTQQVLTVVGLRNPTNIRATASTKDAIIGTYPQGTIIDVKTYSKDWYEHTTNDGKKGYIHHKHVDNIIDNPTTFSGIGLNNPTNIRALASTRSNVFKSLPVGSIIELRTFSTNWYEALEKNKVIGYIHHKHIGDTVNTSQSNFKGIGINNPTNIRNLPSTQAKVAEKRPIGDIIDLKPFSKHWFQATTKNGKTGYVHKYHIGDTVLAKQERFQGIGINSPTNLRELPSTKAKVAEKRPIGDIIDLRTFSEHWYQATTKNGRTGYVHKNHIGDTVLTNKESFKGIGINNPTNVRNLPSTKTKIVEKVSVGNIISLETFSKHWYRATTSKGTKGYVHKNHIGDTVYTKQDPLYGEVLKSQTIIRTLPSTQAKVAGKVKKGATTKLLTYSKHWYEVIDLNNKRIGFIHKNHFNEKDNITHKYNISLKSAVDMQMKSTAAPQTDKKYAWVSKDYIDKNNKVTASSLNVRIGPGTGHKSLGTISKGATVKVLDEHNGWYAIEHNPGDQWRHAGPNDVMYYLNPLNFVNDARQQFQFLDLSRSSSVSATELNKVLNNNGVLHGKGSYFIEAGDKYKINDIYLVSHAKLETGNGSSELAKGISKWPKRDSSGKVVTDGKGNPIIMDISPKKVYNIYGIGAFDNCARDCGAQKAYDNGWFSVNTAIVEGAKFIGNGYINAGQNTLYKMRWNPAAMENGNVTHQYATDIGWAYKQTYTISQLYKQLDSYTLHLDIPVYK